MLFLYICDIFYLSLNDGVQMAVKWNRPDGASFWFLAGDPLDQPSDHPCDPTVACRGDEVVGFASPPQPPSDAELERHFDMVPPLTGRSLRRFERQGD